MQENINIPDSTITTNLSFRNLVLMNMQQLTNFPYIEKDFDALTDYELLCLVVKYLNDVIANQNEQNNSITRMYESFLALQDYVNNTKDELEDAFNNLDDYVRNYFDNLDVQEEIDNKLDEMLEDGVLEQIIEQFLQSTALWCFNTVASMKQATNLTNGSYARTLGYYSINDDGGATYKITSTESQDEYQEVLNNGLYATLISDDVINVKQFGAKGDGINDDTLAIQNAINKCKEDALNNNLIGKSVVTIPGGKYKITSTISTYTYVRLKPVGSVIITTEYDGIAIKLDGGTETLPLIEYNLAYLIDGTDGLRIENTNSNATSSIGLSIENSSEINRKTCNFTIKSIAFNGFKIATKITNNNFYLVKFEDVIFGGNTTGIQFGDSNHTEQSNSGENLVFTRCIFVNTDAIKFYYPGEDCNFFNCSFDYCTNIFNDVGNKGYRKLYINGGHIESITNSILNNMKQSMLIITGCRFFVNPNINLFGSSKPCDIVLENNQYGLIQEPNQNPSTFIFPYTGCIIKNNMMAADGVGTPFGFSSYVPHHTFDNVTTGAQTYVADGMLGSYQMKGQSNIGSMTCLDQNIFGSNNQGKIIQVTKNDVSASSSYLALRSDYIPVEINERYRIYVCGRNCLGNNTITVLYYDINKEWIKTSDEYIYNSGESSSSNDYKMSKHYAVSVVPNNAAYMRISYNFGNDNQNTPTFECAGIFAEKY